MTRAVDGETVVRAMSELRDLLAENRSESVSLRLIDAFASMSPGADCVLLRRDQGVVSVVAATSSTAGRLQEQRVADGGVSAAVLLTRGEPRACQFHPADVPFDPHVGRSINAGFTHEYTFPLDFADTAVGAVVLLDSADQPISQGLRNALHALSIVASVALAHSTALRHARLREEHLESALQSRVVIEQAKGIIAATSTYDMTAAFRVLRDQARRARQPLDTVALATINGVCRPTAK